jgi:hypothetical protein
MKGNDEAQNKKDAGCRTRETDMTGLGIATIVTIYRE